MFNWNTFEKEKNIFSYAGMVPSPNTIGQFHIDIRPKDLLRWIEVVKEDLGYLTLVEMVGVDKRKEEGHSYEFELVYHLLNMGTHLRLNLHVHFNQSEIVPSIVDFYSHAAWIEREQAEMLNVHFDQVQTALILPEGQETFPLRRDASFKSWPDELPKDLPEIIKNPNKSEEPYPEESHEWKRFDLFSAESMGLFEWWVCFDPKKVVKSQVKIGYHHQGFEKLLESKSWYQAMYLVDKIHLGAAPTYSIAWVKNLEESLRIKLPERAQAIRIVMLELARIAEHLTVLYEMTRALGLDEYRLFLNAREKVYELFEKYCGNRQGLGIVKLGGLREDLPHGWIVEYQAVSDILSRNLLLIHRSLRGQNRFRDQLGGQGADAQTVLSWGVSGPAVRASGLNFDLRKSQPFYFYQDIDFDIPVGIHGTAYDRYLIRFEEIFQSLRIINQVMGNLPLGEMSHTLYNKNPFELNEMFQNITLPEGWHFSSLESPNGEAGFFLYKPMRNSPLRIKIKTPSFSLAQALPEFCLGLSQDQLRVCLASLGIRRFEMDR